jgi:hypothetical protein
MRRFLYLAAAFLLLTAFLQAPAEERVVAIGDVHGDFDALVAILQKAGLIGQSRHWSGSNTTLVQTGDLLDRGPKSREVLDLMMALEKEATGRKGKVRATLGNHEVMNMMGDLRYVVPEDYAAFANRQSESRRKQAFRTYSDYLAQKKRVANETQWMQAHPPGFIERQEAFGPRGKYGRWLRGLPAVNKVGDSIFLHGGFSPAVSTWTASKVNDAVKAEIQTFDNLRQYMLDNEVALSFFTLDELMETARAEAGEHKVLEQFLQLGAWLSVHPDGPLWFRGYDTWTEQEGEIHLSGLVEALRVKRIVAGHTAQPNGEIRQRFGGKVFLIDTGMLGGYFPGGKASALEISKDRTRAIYMETE